MSEASVGNSSRNIVVERMWDRIHVARSESETALFYDLMHFGEMLTKLVVIGLVSAVEPDKDRHRYRLEHKLVRANGVGDWVAVLEDMLTGPASSHLVGASNQEKRELTKNWGVQEESWQREAVVALQRVGHCFDADRAPGTGRVALRQWFTDFVWLRNRTRGHGAPTPGTCSRVCPDLERSLRLILENLALFKRGWANLRRTLSLKYHVVSIGGDTGPFNYLKSDKTAVFADGLYVDFDGDLRPLSLVETDIDHRDFFIANGGFKDQTSRTPEYEALSYHSDERRFVDASRYLLPPQALPASETEGQPALEVIGHAFANLPAKLPDYVTRPALEAELRQVLTDDRHPIVTLVGRGGTGKTSLTLEVLHSLAHDGAFFAIVWFSARDIDLLVHGPKSVAPGVLTMDEIASTFVGLVAPGASAAGEPKPLDFLADALGGRLWKERVVFVFDNFETVRNPAEVYEFLDTYVRLPNKVLLTSRFRDFKADYPVGVGGMTRSEFDELVRVTGIRLGITALLTESYLTQLFDEADGHPYVTKVLLGEVARSRTAGSVQRVMAAQDEILNALFERTYNSISPAARRVFLTLCSWRSMVPTLGLEAALMRPANERMDVVEALETLEQSSLIELVGSPDQDGEFVRVPLAASVFGQRKLRASPMKSAVEADMRILQAFGAAQVADAAQGLGPRVRRMVRELAVRLQAGEDIGESLAVLEFIARKYPPAWLDIAELHLEDRDSTGRDRAANAITAYLEWNTADRAGWLKLAELNRLRRDGLGEIHARFQAAQLPGAPLDDVSNAASTLNRLLANHMDGLDHDERRAMGTELASMMQRRIQEADATDLSRLAWLYLHLNREDDARDCVRRGVALDPSNSHCRKLADRLLG